ncbi:MAG TPA: SH3 domain-containing protein, partial [Pyrinomonadaceae bacterium]
AAEAGSYISGAFLDTALEWRNRHSPNVAWAERYRSEVGLKVESEKVMAFLDVSAAHRDALVEEEEKRRHAELERERRELEQAQAFAQQQQRAKRRLLWLTAALCLILLFALGTAIYAMRARATAEQNEKKAVKTQEAGTAYRDALSSLKIKDVDDARAQFDKAAKQFTEINDISGAAASYMELGDTYFNGSLGKINWEEGAKYYDKADELNQNNKDLNGKASVLRAMGDTFINAARSVLDESGDVKTALNLLDKGKRSLERAREIYQSEKNQESEILVLNQLGDGISDWRFWADSKEAYSNAIKYYDQMLDIYEKQSSSPATRVTALPNHRAMALKLAGISEDLIGDQAAARKYRDKALAVAQSQGGIEVEAATRLEIARSFGLGDSQSQEFEKALKLFEGATDRLPEAELLIKIAEMRLKPYRKIAVRGVNLREGPSTKDKIIKALEKDINVLVLAEGEWLKISYDNQKGFIHSKFARKEQEVRDTKSEGLKSTLGYFKRALDIYQARGMLTEQADLYKRMADVDIGAKTDGDKNRALVSLKGALKIYKDLKDNQAQIELLNQIVTLVLENADAYKKAGKWQPANDSYAEAARLFQDNPALKQLDSGRTLFARAYIGGVEMRETLKQP